MESNDPVLRQALRNMTDIFDTMAETRARV